MRHLTSTFALAILAAAPAFSAAQGLIIPTEPDLPPLALTGHTVKVEIDHQAAVTTVEQVFLNNTERQLEAQYLFPVPKGAAMTRFTMLVDGKEKAGELMKAGEALSIYRSIVARNIDPGLLECLGSELFRANIFPIAPHGTQTITLKFSQVVPMENNLVSYTYPVRAQGRKGMTVNGRCAITIDVKAAAPIRNIYSPSHSVTISRPDERRATVAWSAVNAKLDKDFQLFYGFSADDVGLHLVTSRPDPAQPGYFMLLASPHGGTAPVRIVERDVVFVIDVSGSMAGEKIAQARGALKQGINSLNEGDRFNIVPFSTVADPWRRELGDAKTFRASALAFADTLLAQGGTDICGAMEAALSYPRDTKRPYFIVFMTDGKPTQGATTDPKEILARILKVTGAEPASTIRLFTWGVGYDVDTQLLDGMAEAVSGVSEYVKPEENIEAKVSAFFAKASRPVLSNLDLKVEGDKVQLVNLTPGRLPDLYAGAQLVLFGRYTGTGDIAMTLTGRVNDEGRNFVYEGKFPAEEKKNAFIEPLWGKRRIGMLLEQIRLHGETKELVDDVVRLSLEYGIQTPYTSYLILEDGTRVTRGTRPGTDREPMENAHGLFPGQGGAARPPGTPGDKAASKDADALSTLSRGAAPRPSGTPTPATAEAAETRKRDEKSKAEFEAKLQEGFTKKDGKAAVETAGYLKALKESNGAQGDDARATAYEKAMGTKFYSYLGMWVDERFTADAAVTSVKFGSEAYFRLIEKKPELVEALKLGNAVIIITAPGKALVVGANGEEKLDDAKIDALFAK